jgi:hypothetical protein
MGTSVVLKLRVKDIDDDDVDRTAGPVSQDAQQARGGAASLLHPAQVLESVHEVGARPRVVE